MLESISTRNDLGQPQIFLSEMISDNRGLLKCPMGKSSDDDQIEIFLGGWLKLFGMGPTEAGRVGGCGQSYISNIATGRRTDVNALILLKISNKLGVTVNDFFLPPPSPNKPASFMHISPKARDSVIKHWEEEARKEVEKPAKKRAGGRR